MKLWNLGFPCWDIDLWHGTLLCTNAQQGQTRVPTSAYLSCHKSFGRVIWQPYGTQKPGFFLVLFTHQSPFLLEVFSWNLPEFKPTLNSYSSKHIFQCDV